jgi:phosphoglucosamine mutase
MKSKLFGSSGIRGIANEEITISLAERIGRALATMYSGDTIVIGRDARTTGSARAGGSVIRTPVGDSYIAEAIVEHNAIFEGDPIGAWIHPEVHMCPDGILSSLKLIEALEVTEMNLTEFISQVPQYPIDRARIRCPNKYKIKLIDYISRNFQNNFRKVECVSEIDGIRLELENGWVLIRPSGTEPFMRITVEGKTKEDLNALKKSKNLVKNMLRKIK